MTSRPKAAIPPEFQLAYYEDIKTRRVLVVDCHAAARTYLRSQLSALGVKSVMGAVSSSDVLRLVRFKQFDIILCDFMLEDDHDGQQLLEELRTRRLIALATIFIIVTGEAGYLSVVSVAELAPDEYLVKPFTTDQLNGRLMRAMYKRKVFSEVYRSMEAGAADEAIAACAAVARRHAAFAFEASRMRGDILCSQRRDQEAEALYRAVLAQRLIPWAKMGLATSVFHQGRIDEARTLAEELIDEFPQYLAAHDFLARVHEQAGDLPGAQAALQRATEISPRNTARQRAVGDVALRNADLETADKAYSNVLERGARSSLATVDDYASLARVKLERGDADAASKISQSLKRAHRGDRQAELAALVMDSLAARHRGEEAQAGALLDQALAVNRALAEAGGGVEPPVSLKLSVDLAHACLANGREELGEGLLKKAAAEYQEDAVAVHQIRRVFASVGREEEADALIETVNREIVEINNDGVMRARRGDLEGSVELLTRAADSVPNIQFLVNATKAIFTLLDRRGWDEALARRGLDYLRKAEAKGPRDPKVESARAMSQAVAIKYGVTVEAFAGAVPVR